MKPDTQHILNKIFISFLLLLVCQCCFAAEDTNIVAASDWSELTNGLGGQPAPQICQTKEKLDLGTWDDVFVCKEQDCMILRRGDTLFSLAMSASSKPSKLVSASELKNAHFVTSAGSDNGIWLFMQSSESAPFAINTHSGQISQFNISGLKIPGSQTPAIQSYIIVQQADAAILMVAGGDHATWPREGNWPIYFWMNLKSGKVVQIPIGCDLDYFSADQKVAVFMNKQVIDVTTGDSITNFEMRENMEVVPFGWTETQSIKPLALWHQWTRAGGSFAGLSVGGEVFPVAAGFDGVNYLATAKANDGFVGFRLRHDGAPRMEPSPFWLMCLKQDQPAELSATGVIDFAILNSGNCVFTSVEDKQSGSSEAWFRNYQSKAKWNVLDGVRRLPDLDKEFAGKNYITDKMTTRLIEGFGGNKNNPFALCIFEHNRLDMRQMMVALPQHRLADITWRRAVLMTSTGERYMTDIFREGNIPDNVWVHNSGKIFTGAYIYSPTGRKIHLSEISFTNF
jgi:hypothetical protein